MVNLAPVMSAGGYACVFSVALTPIVRDVFRSYNVVDRPGRRKVHTYPIPRIGGIPIAIAYAFALNALRGPVAGFPLHWLQTLLSGTAIIFVTGLIDDFLNLKPRVKFGAQIVAALVAFFNGLTLDHVGNTALPVWISLPLTVFWLLLTTNALNLIDGLDGLCGGMAFWAALTFFAVGFTHGNHTLAFTALPLCLVLLGFLAFNFYPATVFLGDSGALTLGFLLGCYGIVWSRHRITAGSLAVTLLALTVPLLDLGLSIVRRTLRKRPIFSADRGHIHHMLLHRGLSVRRAALTLYAVAITGGLAALLLSHTGGYPVLRIVIAAVLVLLTFAGIRELRYAEFEVSGRLLFRGEFQRIFAAKLRMTQLAQALERAGSPGERWVLLVAAAGEWNCIAVKWISPGDRREEVLSSRMATWSLLVHLSMAETIQIEGDSETAELPELAAILSRNFPAEARELRQPAAS